MNVKQNLAYAHELHLDPGLVFGRVERFGRHFQKKGLKNTPDQMYGNAVISESTEQ